MAISQGRLSDSDAASLVKARVDVFGANAFRRPFERQILKNRAFFAGKQYFVEDSKTGELRDVRNVPAYQKMAKANLMQGDLIRSVLTVAGANGEFVVPPKKATRQAERAAWVSTKLFEHISEQVDIEEIDQLATMIAALDGSAIRKIHWNPELGEKIRFYHATPGGKKVKTIVDDRQRVQLEEAGEYEDQALGDVAMDVQPIFQTWWDWKARDQGFKPPCLWAATASIVSREWLEDRFPNTDLSGVTYGQSYSGALYYNEMISYLSGSQNGYPGLLDDEKSDQTLFVEYWEVPTMQNRQLGRRIDWAGETVIINTENDYRVTGYPIPLVKQDWITMPGRFLGISLAESLIQPQAVMNFAISKKMEFVGSHGSPNTFIPEAWGVDPDKLTNRSGAVHKYNHLQGGDVKYGPTPELPKEVAELAGEQRGLMGEISSQRPIENTGQLRSASGIEALQETRNQLLIMSAKNFLKAKRHAGEQALALAQKFYPPERVLHYVGEDQRLKVMEFKRADINSDLRLIIDKGKLLASPAAARSKVLELVQIGVLNPQLNAEDKADVIHAVGFATGEHLVSDRLQEEENQEREIEEMLDDPQGWIAARPDTQSPMEMDPQTGRPMPRIVHGYPTNEFDDDPAHARTLSRYMRSQEYRDLALQGEKGILAQSVLRLHLQEHNGKIQQQMLQQIQMQQLMQGSPGQSGQASPPKQQALG